MAQIADKVCRAVANGGIVVGRVVPALGQEIPGPPAGLPVAPVEPAVPGVPVPETRPQLQLAIQWEGRDAPTPLTEFPYQIYDRTFEEGERVIRADGAVGKVLRISQTITLAIHGSDFVIQNIDLDRLHPLVDIFPGVKVHYDGWVGEVVDLKRRLRLEYASGTQFLINEESLNTENIATSTNQYIPIHSTDIRLEQNADPDPDLLNAYPYSQSCRIPALGQTMTFKWFELQNVDWQVPQTFFGILNRPYWLGCRYRNHPARVTAVEVREVTVEWEESLSPGTTLSSVPRNLWSGPRVTELQLLPVPKTLYFFPNSLMLLRIRETDMVSVIHIRDWEKKLCDLNTGAPVPAKIRRLEPPCAPNTTVSVRGLLLQNKVTVDYGNSDIWTGLPTALRRDPSYTLMPVDKSKFFTIKKRHLDPTPGRFGINRGPSRENEGFLEIHWYQELHGNLQAVADLGRKDAPVLDLNFPESYNWFSPGMLVAKTTASARDFTYAAVKQVHRNGKISLRLAKQDDSLEVWPFEIERCGQNPPSLVYSVVPDPRSIFGLFRNLPATTTPIGKWECLKEIPEGNYFVNEPDYKYGNDPSFFRVLLAEIVGLEKTLPEDVWVKSYEDKINTLSVLMKGTEGTPYESCLFVFEIYLPQGYPLVSPKVHFVRMSTAGLGEDLKPADLLDIERLVARLPPESHGDNLSHVTGGPKVLSIATVVLAIRKGIFLNNPYLAVTQSLEVVAGVLAEQTRQYNQEIYIGVLDSIYELIVNPPDPWVPVIRSYYAQQLSNILPRVRQLVSGWGTIMDSPRFPLVPLTAHAKASIERRLEVLEQFSN